MTVLVLDFDDTLFEVLPLWVERYNEVYGEQKDPENVRTWEWEPEFTLEERNLLWKVRDAALYRDVVPRPYAQDTVARLIGLGYEVAVCTTEPNDDVFEAKKKLMDRFFPDVPMHREKDKHDFLKERYGEEGYILVDDGAHNNPHILFHMPHNAQEPWQRIYCWSELMPVLEVMGW